MKKVICLVISVVFVLYIEAQNNVKSNLGDFTEIELTDASSIRLIQSDENAVVTNSNAHSNVEVRGGVLYISSGFTGTVYVKKLAVITATDASTASSEDTLSTDELTIHTSSSGSIKLFVKARKITADAKDAGMITLKGSTDVLEAKASDAAHVRGFDLKAGTVNAIASDGSREDVWAVANIDAKASDGSSIHVKGSPAQKNTSATDGSSITMDDSGEETIPAYNRHMGWLFDKEDSLHGKGKHFEHHYSEGLIGFGFVIGGNNEAPIEYGTSREFIVGLGGGV